MSNSATTKTSVPRVLPAEDDRDTAGFWEAARRRQLVVRVCDSCGTVLHMPRAYCNHCGSWTGSWKSVSGMGRLHSWTTVTHQVHPSFPVPYTILLVQLDDEPSVRYVGNLPGAPELHEGQALEVWFEELEDGVTIPQWRPVD
jgi:uncharacterized protein